MAAGAPVVLLLLVGRSLPGLPVRLLLLRRRDVLGDRCTRPGLPERLPGGDAPVKL
jgi:hypothetical protein